MSIPNRPNILITGTPGTGKTTLAALVAQELSLTHIEIGKVVKEQKFFSNFDAACDTHDMEEEDEDRLLDFLEPQMVAGGKVVDYHASELFPERWFGLVIVLHADTEVLYDRLTARGYSTQKRDENMEAEITCVCEEEAMASYREDLIVVRQNNTIDDMELTTDIIRDRLGL